jgi:hypothetical protein
MKHFVIQYAESKGEPPAPIWPPREIGDSIRADSPDAAERMFREMFPKRHVIAVREVRVNGRRKQ